MQAVCYLGLSAPCKILGVQCCLIYSVHCDSILQSARTQFCPPMMYTSRSMGSCLTCTPICSSLSSSLEMSSSGTRRKTAVSERGVWDRLSGIAAARLRPSPDAIRCQRPSLLQRGREGCQMSPREAAFWPQAKPLEKPADQFSAG